MERHRRCDSGRKGVFGRKPFIIQALAMPERFKSAEHLVVLPPPGCARVSRRPTASFRWFSLQPAAYDRAHFRFQRPADDLPVRFRRRSRASRCLSAFWATATVKHYSPSPHAYHSFVREGVRQGARGIIHASPARALVALPRLHPPLLPLAAPLCTVNLLVSRSR